jgi:hypothetical protein
MSQMYIFKSKVSARSDREATRGDEDRRRSGCGADAKQGWDGGGAASLGLGALFLELRFMGMCAAQFL